MLQSLRYLGTLSTTGHTDFSVTWYLNIYIYINKLHQIIDNEIPTILISWYHAISCSKSFRSLASTDSVPSWPEPTLGRTDVYRCRFSPSWTCAHGFGQPEPQANFQKHTTRICTNTGCTPCQLPHYIDMNVSKFIHIFVLLGISMNSQQLPDLANLKRSHVWHKLRTSIHKLRRTSTMMLIACKSAMASLLSCGCVFNLRLVLPCDIEEMS